MRIGTPGFVAARLTEGREARGLTQTALAELTGIKSQSISHYEQGRQSPSPEALALLSASLKLPERFFLHSVSPSPGEGVFFYHPAHIRASARTARLQAERHLGWARDIHSYLRRYIELPVMRIPRLAADAAGDIEKAADTVREALHGGFGPLDELVALVEDAGCVVVNCAADPEPHRSYSQWIGDVPFLAVSAGEGSSSSWIRYAIARELGRIALQWHPEREAPEDEADRFARAFLLPARTFTGEVWAPTINALLTLKRDWRCPIAEMVRRCTELGIFDPAQSRRAVAGLARRGWKAAEPREEDPAGETPQLLARSMRLLIDEERKDRHGVLCDLALNAVDVEQICGLPHGYFTAGHAPPQTLRLRRDDEAGTASELLWVDPRDVMIA